MIQNKPEIYLRGEMATEGVTLDLMTELYQQARQAGAVTTADVNSAAQLFEHCRTRGIAGGRLWKLGHSAKHDAAQLRYLMACLEEINRIEGMRLMLSQAQDKQMSVPGIRDTLQGWWNETVQTGVNTTDTIMAYSLA